MTTPTSVGEAAVSNGQRTPRSRPLRVARILLGVAATVFLAIAITKRWAAVRGELGRVSIPSLALAEVAILAALAAGMMAWRAVLTDLGSPLPIRAGARVMLLGQLGKYVPGGLWSVVAQTELASDLDVPRRRSAAAAMVYNLLSLGIGLLLAVISLPALLGSQDIPAVAVWLVAASPALLVLLAPPLLTRLVDLLLRLLRRGPLEHPFTWGGVVRAVGWTVLMWFLTDLHIWLLGVGLGADPASFVLPSIGGYAAAWSVGFLVVVAPAGAGVREAILTVTLAPWLAGGAAAALTIAVVSRLLTTLGDLIAALVGHGLGRPTTPRRTKVTSWPPTSDSAPER